MCGPILSRAASCQTAANERQEEVRMKVHELVALCARAAEAPDPMASARALLEELKADVAAIDRALAYIPGTGGNARQVFYRAPNLTLLKGCFPRGRRTPP